MPAHEYARTAWKSQCPPGKLGAARVEAFVVTEMGAQVNNLRAAFSASSRYLPPGAYRRLFVHGELMMSDTPVERKDCAPLFDRAQGPVLVHGLGLGCCVQVLLETPEVESVTVVELSQDVIELVGSHLQERYGEKLQLVQGDALTRKPAPDERYNVIWHDIWKDLNTDNLSQITTLKRHWARRCDWQRAWGEDLLRQQRRKSERRDYRSALGGPV